MFFESKKDKLIRLLEQYININNIIYSEKMIKESIDEFNNEYNALNSKCNAGIKGYEMYTDSYILSKRIELYDKLFEEYPSLNNWAAYLKAHLKMMGEDMVKQIGLMIGTKNDKLLSSEILFNEAKVKKTLIDLRINEQVENIYKKK